MKWQNLEREERLVKSGDGGDQGSGREEGMVIKGHNRSLWWWNCSVFWLNQCQYSGYDIVLESCRMLLLGKIGWSMAKISILFLTTTCESTIISE